MDVSPLFSVSSLVFFPEWPVVLMTIKSSALVVDIHQGIGSLLVIWNF